MIWFTSDLHLGHEKILTLGKGRPFDTIEEHDEVLISNINRVTKPGDTLYIIGDFTTRIPTPELRAYRDRIDCKDIWLIRGNHDAKGVEQVFGPDKVRDIYKIKPRQSGLDVPIVLCHYAMRTWPQSHRGSWMLYGHSHGMLPDDGTTLSFDVGVDCWDYKPVSLKWAWMTVKARINQDGAGPVNHHPE